MAGFTIPMFLCLVAINAAPAAQALAFGGVRWSRTLFVVACALSTAIALAATACAHFVSLLAEAAFRRSPREAAVAVILAGALEAAAIVLARRDARMRRAQAGFAGKPLLVRLHEIINGPGA